MPRGFAGLALVLAAAFSLAAASQPVSVASVIDLVRSYLSRHEPDNKLAGQLHKLSLAERLGDLVIEELESDGAGPKSVAALMDLRDTSAGLPVPAVAPPFFEPPVPPPSEQSDMLHAAAANAVSYASHLPDFICSERVHRYQDTPDSLGWRLKDTLQLKLTYFNRKEKYELVSVDDQSSDRVYDYQSLGGAVSQGEFGSDLLSIFLAASKTTFQWNHWTHLRQRPTHVFSYSILAANSRYHLDYVTKGSQPVRAIAGQHGYVYVDAETRQVLRINRISDLPADFPIRRATTLLDYDFVKVGDRQFLLPLRAETRMTTDFLLTRNQIEFTSYRKFEGESKITFDVRK